MTAEFIKDCIPASATSTFVTKFLTAMFWIPTFQLSIAAAGTNMLLYEYVSEMISHDRSLGNCEIRRVKTYRFKILHRLARG